MSIFVIAEREQPINELCGGARTFSDDVRFVAMPGVNALDNIADTVYDLQVPQGHMAEDAAPALACLIAEEAPEAVFCEPSRRIQLLMGRVCARLESSVISNVMDVRTPHDVKMMYFGGLADRELTTSGTAFYFVRPATFPGVEASGGNNHVSVDYLEGDYEVTRTGTSELVKGDIDLPAAKRILSVGRGVKSIDDLPMIQELCDLFGAEMACSRSIYEEEKWLPKEALVGISGNTVTPKMYMAIGISGQSQHTVAIQGTETIVAINTDEHAEIYGHTDYGCVADLYTVVPRMIEYFKENPLK